MIYYVYILYSNSLDRYYVGSSGDIQDRLSRHNGGRSKSTKAGVPWSLVFYESFETRALAVQRELEIKKRKKRAYIESLVASFNPDLKQV
jgi:putative endonuclease